jgi:hypothetical protein
VSADAIPRQVYGIGGQGDQNSALGAAVEIIPGVAPNTVEHDVGSPGRLAWRNGRVYQHREDVGVDEGPRDGRCPIKIDSDAYDAMAQLVQQGTVDANYSTGFSDMLDPFLGTQTNHLWDSLAAKRPLFATLLALLNENSHWIQEPDRSALVERGGGYCDLKSNAFEFIRYGSITTYSFPSLQITSSILIIIWGLALLAVAWPYKCFVLNGSLDQWMSLGADLGSAHMRGASTGNRGSESQHLCCLRDEADENGVWRLRLREWD